MTKKDEGLAFLIEQPNDKNGMFALKIAADEEWIEYCDGDDLFYTNYCGYWMRGMVHEKKNGWLAFEHGGDKRPPEKVPHEVLTAWRSGDKLPEGWLRLDRAAMIRAQAYATLQFGKDWYGSGNTDAHTYDYVIQMALLGEMRYS